MKCPDCGADNAENGVYCGRCGTQLREFSIAPDPEDNRVTPVPVELDRVMTGGRLNWLTALLGIAAITSAIEYLLGDHNITDLAVIVIGAMSVAIYIAFKTWGKESTVGSMEYMRSHLAPGTGGLPTGESSRVRAARLSVLAGFATVGALSCAFLGLALHLESSTDNLGWVVALVMGVAVAAVIPWTLIKNPMELQLTKDGIGQSIAVLGSTMWLTRKDIERVEVRGRIMSIHAKNAPFGQRRPTYVLFCGADRLGEVNQWAGAFGSGVAK